MCEVQVRMHQLSRAAGARDFWVRTLAACWRERREPVIAIWICRRICDVQVVGWAKTVVTVTGSLRSHSHAGSVRTQGALT
jgi:hypothetical protein